MVIFHSFLYVYQRVVVEHAKIFHGNIPWFSTGKAHGKRPGHPPRGLDVALQMWLRAVKRDIRISLAAPRWQSSWERN